MLLVVVFVMTVILMAAMVAVVPVDVMLRDRIVIQEMVVIVVWGVVVVVLIITCGGSGKVDSDDREKFSSFFDCSVINHFLGNVTWLLNISAWRCVLPLKTPVKFYVQRNKEQNKHFILCCLSKQHLFLFPPVLCLFYLTLLLLFTCFVLEAMS